MEMKSPMDLKMISAMKASQTPKKLEGLKDEKLWKAAKDFESMFVDMVMKSMRSTSEVMESSDFGASPQEKMFQEMLDTEYSKKAGDTSRFGLADALFKQFTQKPTEGSGELK